MAARKEEKKYPAAGVICFKRTSSVSNEGNDNSQNNLFGISHVLLVKTIEGHYGFPKGRRETYDKSMFDNAIRELKEETGLTADDFDFLPLQEDIIELSLKGNPSVFYHMAILKDSSATKPVKLMEPEEHSEVAWTEISQAKKLLFSLAKKRHLLLESALKQLAIKK